MEPIESTLKSIEARLQALEIQIHRMNRVHLTQTQEATSIIEKSSLPQNSQNSQKIGVHDVPLMTLNDKKSASFFESSSVLGIIGVGFVILAGVFFIKISIESGWLTPWRQILTAGSLGVLFFLAPQFMAKKEKQYGALIAGAGTVILHFTWLGAYHYHHLINSTFALLCGTLVGVLSLLAQFNHGHRIYLLVAMAGTYLSAPLFQKGEIDLAVLSMFFLIWNFSFTAVALVNRCRDVIFIAAYCAVFSVLLLSGQYTEISHAYILLYLQLSQFIIFTVAMLVYSIFNKQTLTSTESTAALPLLLLVYFSTNYLVEKVKLDAAPWIGLSLATVALLTYFISRKLMKGVSHSERSLTSFIAIASVNSLYFQFTDEVAKPLVGLILSIPIAILWFSQPDLKNRFAWPLRVLLAAVVYSAILTFAGVDDEKLSIVYNGLYGVVAFGAALAFKSGSARNESISNSKLLLLGFAHLEILLGLYRASRLIDGSSSLFVTATWGLYALTVLALAYWRQDQGLGKSALLVLFAVSFKAFLFDVNDSTNLTRVTCLLLEGLLLYLCGWIYKRMKSWQI